MSSSGATTRPTWWRGSTRALRANTSYSRTERWTRVIVTTDARPSYGKAPQLEGLAPFGGQHGARPGRVPDHLDDDLLDARLGQQLPADVVEGHLVSRAAHRGEGQLDLDQRTGDLDLVDQAEVGQADRHLGVLDLGEGRPAAILERQAHCPRDLRSLW